MTLGKRRMKMALLAKNSEIAVTPPVTMATEVGQWLQCFLDSGLSLKYLLAPSHGTGMAATVGAAPLSPPCRVSHQIW